ncbi:MAG TPA: hypothetical protein GXZ90_06565 [Clostridiales bacterium]|nr:hypothetical protein [Clostridiales bacterium]
MNLKKEQNKYKVLLIIGIFIFIGSIVLTMFAKLENLENLSEISRYLNGFASALIGISILSLYYIKNKPEKITKQIIEQNDERNISIRGYAASVTLMIALITTSIMLLIFIVLGYTISLIIGMVLILINLFSFMFLTRYYSKKI